MSPRRTQFPYRPGPFAFRPPLHSAAVMLFGRIAAPLFLRTKGIVRVEFAQGSRNVLRGLSGTRAVLTPNHPGYEPVALFQLSFQLPRRFWFLAAKEVFLKSPLQGFVAQRIGAYSIVRGVNDRESIRMTRELLARGERHLVAFPEGQDHYHGDLLLPFQPGVVQLAFWALDKLAEGGAAPPLLLIPAAVRYHCLRDMLPVIDRALARLERRLRLPPPDGLGRYSRLLRIADVVITANEQAYGVQRAAEADLRERLRGLLDAMLARIAEQIPVKPPPPEQPLRDRLRTLFNAVEQVPAAAAPSEYGRELAEQRQAHAAHLYRELDRVLGFVAASGNYVSSQPTQERFLDVLARLERELYGTERSFGPKRALVSVGEPIDLAQRYGDYLADKRGTVGAITLELESRVQALLDATAHLQRPMEL